MSVFLFHESTGILNCLANGRVVTYKGHITYDKRPFAFRALTLIGEISRCLNITKTDKMMLSYSIKRRCPLPARLSQYDQFTGKPV